MSAVGQVSPMSEAAGAGAVHLGVEDRVGAPLHLRSGMGQSVNNVFFLFLFPAITYFRVVNI